MLLPSNDSLVPDVKKAGAGIIQGLETAKNRSLINENLKFKLTFRETKCNNIYGPKSFTDAVVEGVDVLFGPSCEYALGKFEIISLFTHPNFQVDLSKKSRFEYPNPSLLYKQTADLTDRNSILRKIKYIYTEL